MRFPAHFSRDRRFYDPGMIQKPIGIRALNFPSLRSCISETGSQRTASSTGESVRTPAQIFGRDEVRAFDLAPHKLRVTSVHPGPIDTEMPKVRTPEQNQQRLQLVPMKRMGTAEEVAIDLQS